MKKNINNNKNGITLIALVITIVIMLILASVTISFTINGGLLEYAKLAKDKTNEVMQNEALLSNIITDESFLEEIMYGKSGDFKTVNYKNTVFLISGQTGNRITLIPLTFSAQNNYMLSGKYKVINGRQVSVDPNDANSLADETFDDFSNRITAELNYECQERFGTSDNKIIATNTQSGDITLGDILLAYLSSCESNAPTKNFTDITAAIEYENNNITILANALPSQTFEINWLVNNAFQTISNMLLNHCNNIITSCEFESINISQADQQEIYNNVTLLLTGEETINSIDSSNAFNRQAAILTYYSICATLGNNNQFYINQCIKENEGTDDECWRINAYDAIDGYTIFDPLKDSLGYHSLNLYLAPVLQVDTSLLQRTGRNTYRINVN